MVLNWSNLGFFSMWEYNSWHCSKENTYIERKRRVLFFSPHSSLIRLGDLGTPILSLPELRKYHDVDFWTYKGEFLNIRNECDYYCYAHISQKRKTEQSRERDVYIATEIKEYRQMSRQKRMKLRWKMNTTRHQKKKRYHTDSAYSGKTLACHINSRSRMDRIG